MSGYQVWHCSFWLLCTSSDRIQLKILFSFNNGDLTLQTKKPGDSQILLFIPRSELIDDFPTCLIDEYFHWLDRSTRELEFRPAASPWTSEASNWRLYINEPDIHPRAILRRPSQGISSTQVIDIRSSTFGVISSLLSPLESPKYIMATHNTTQMLEVSLPRFRLSFFVNSNWEFECRGMPGYVIDKTQTCGTMFGLENNLVLRPSATGSEDSLLPRRVIIPQGEVCFRKNGDFASISINIGSGQHVRYHEYTIDPILGCLTSNGSLSDKLYQCYLHALTSHCLPDPLLGHSGTEEALYILQSASCRSFQRLDVHEAKLLELIGNLTPNREYYPRHLQSMSTVEWKDLPILAQHHSFFPIACSIFDHARALEVLYDPPTTFDMDTLNRNQSLLNRATSRNKTYYPSDIQISEQPPSPDDVIYKSRDVSDLGTAEHVAFQTSWSILNAQPSLGGRSLNLWDLINSWGSLGPSDNHFILRAFLSDSEVSLRYNKYWLEFDAAQDWFVIYDLCQHAGNGDGRNSKIELSFSFSAAAYGNSKHKDIVPFLVIFALNKTCLDFDPPPDCFYMLTDGLSPGLTHLQSLVSKNALPIQSTPVRFSELKKKRRKAEYKAAIEREAEAFAKAVLRQWPDYDSVDFPEEWFSIYVCKNSIEEYKQSISRNNGLKDHVLQLQGVVQQYVDKPMPAARPYKYSPQFMTSSSKAPSYSIPDVLMTRTDIPSLPENGKPFKGHATWGPPTAATEGITPRVGSDSLEILLHELRNSQQPLWKLYGNELSRSHCELLRQDALRPAQGAIPPHRLLIIYHDVCLRGKDNIFSEISTALSPSQNVEKTHGISGLWPRITPRSLLRQLARDRISKLPNQWRSVIMRYATSLLKYRHSVRLLELSSGQRNEELLRETDAICNDVLAESTPDWLLIQVRLSYFT